MGSHLVDRLLASDAKVFVFDWKLGQPGYFVASELGKKCVCIDGDLKDKREVFSAVEKNQIDFIFHIGAQALVTVAYEDPCETFGSNIMGTVNVLEAARLSRTVKGVLVASSDKAYGKDCVDAKEDQKVFGDHPYDASKASADMISQTYFKTYGLPVAVARFGNIFGPGDMNLSRIVPGIMEAMAKNQELPIRSDGQFRRDYLYVKDVVAGYMQMAEKIGGIRGEAFNFSTNWNFSVIELIEKIGEVVGQKCEYKIFNEQKNEIPAQSLNSEKAKKVLNWQPAFRVDDAILETFKWYKNHLV